MKDISNDDLEFLSGWHYGFCFGSVVMALVNEDYPLAKRFFEEGLDAGELGFKRLGTMSIHKYLESKNLPIETKQIIATLHKGIHMKQERVLDEAFQLLVKFSNSPDTESNGERFDGSRADSSGSKQHSHPQ